MVALLQRLLSLRSAVAARITLQAELFVPLPLAEVVLLFLALTLRLEETDSDTGNADRWIGPF